MISNKSVIKLIYKPPFSPDSIPYSLSETSKALNTIKCWLIISWDCIWENKLWILKNQKLIYNSSEDIYIMLDASANPGSLKRQLIHCRIFMWRIGKEVNLRRRSLIFL